MLPSPSSSPAATSSRAQRLALKNKTNVHPTTTPTAKRQAKLEFALPTPPRFEDVSKRPQVTENGLQRKRIKLSPQVDNVTGEDGDTDSDSDVEMEGLDNSRSRARPNMLFHNWHNKLSSPFGRGQPYLDTRPILRSFVSSNKADVFKCESRDTGYALTVPYACAYSHGAKRGKDHLLAVATERGTIHIMNTKQRDDWEPEPQRTIMQIHSNGIFDVKWDPSDTLLATSSGDQTMRIICPRTFSVLHTCQGHVSTVKCVAWDPNHRELLSTGGRDGTICLWDLRVAEGRDGDLLAPVFSITKAQEDPTKRKPRGRKPKNQITTTSVTSILFPEEEPYRLISSGSADGKLKSWDLRKCYTSSMHKAPPEYLCSSPLDPTTYHGSQRPRGITNISSGIGPTAGLLFALGTDSYIHTYTLPSLTPQIANYTQDTMSTNSFYVRTSISPCGRWLACGGTGPQRNVFLYDVSNAGRPSKPSHRSSFTGVELSGQLGEVGAVDWAEGMLATCADDGTVRVWRPNVDLERQCREQPEEKRWDWCWAHSE